MINNLLNYLVEKRISHKKISDRLIYINGEYYVLKQAVNGLMFNKVLKFIDDFDTENSKYFVFKFGGVWYYTEKDSTKFNYLNYLGKIVSDVETLSFLGVHGGFELLNGSGLYENWVKKAKFLGVKYLGICEKNTLAGVAKFQFECQNQDISPIIGEEITINSKKGNKYTVKVYVENETGWLNLLSINKEINTNPQKCIDTKLVSKFLEGLVLVHDPKTIKFEDIELPCHYYQLDTVIYDDNNRDKEYLLNLKKFVESKYQPVNIVDAYYIEKEDSHIKNVLNGISNSFDYKSKNQYFKDNQDYFDELSYLIRDDDRFEGFILTSINNSLKIAKKCLYNIKKGERHLPVYEMTPEEQKKYKTNEDLFWGLIEEGLEGKKVDIEKYLNKIEYEFSVIEKGGVIDYFLMLHDIISWCKRNDIYVGIGRGSAGGSVVSYILGLIHLDPLEFNLLFERFLNEGRIKKSLPDIDTDVETSRRDDVKRYMETRYGEQQVVSVGTYTALQLKAAIKDLGRIYGLNFDEVNDITKKLKKINSFDELIDYAVKDKEVRDFVKYNPELINDIRLIIGQPKAKSIHACAMIIFPKDKDMWHWAPIVQQGDLYVSEWEGPEMETVGFLKEDILGVNQLDKFRNIINLLKKRGVEETIYKTVYDDPLVYEYFCNGWTEDNFHFGSRGLKKYCKELKPKNINDLIAGISLYRPGAIENNFHSEYILRKNGIKDVDYKIGTEKILDKTYGIFIYQEQIMELCRVLGGLTMVEADDVRKAMVKKKYEELTKYKERFIPYYIENFSVDKDYAEEVWDEIDKASTYLFNKCISGDEIIKSIGVPYKYNIRELFKLRNDKNFAKNLGVGFYYDKKYGYSWSLNENKRLVKNKIIDIRYVGIHPIYRMTLTNGSTIDVTSNHKFPTSNGEKMLKDIDIVNDKIYYNIGYKKEKYKEPLLGDGNLNSKKGVEGFVKKPENSTEFLKLDFYKKNLKKDRCENCGRKHKRLEVHHKDGNHANNGLDNLATLCPSCHKKEHYKIGRVKIGEKGLYTELIEIKDISFLKNGDVYDVEMDNPYHTFTNMNNIVTSNSHAAAYAITGYLSQYFKVHYPVEYWVTAFEFLSQEDINHGKISDYISEIKATGKINVYPVDINISTNKITTDGKSIYWSITGVKQIGDISSEYLFNERAKNGDYFSLDEFISRMGGKDSKVNKAHIENLIISGAFDKIENIGENISLRLKLIEFYRGKKKITEPFNESSDIYENWWWAVQQKKLSGISYINYEEIIDKYLESDCPLIDFDDFQELEYDSRYYSCGGLIVEVFNRKSQNGGDYITMKIDSNFNYVYVNIFPKHYKQLVDKCTFKEGNLILLTGMVKFDDYRQENVIKVWDKSEVLTIDL